MNEYMPNNRYTKIISVSIYGVNRITRFYKVQIWIQQTNCGDSGQDYLAMTK